VRLLAGSPTRTLCIDGLSGHFRLTDGRGRAQLTKVDTGNHDAIPSTSSFYHSRACGSVAHATCHAMTDCCRPASICSRRDIKTDKRLGLLAKQKLASPACSTSRNKKRLVHRKIRSVAIPAIDVCMCKLTHTHGMQGLSASTCLAWRQLTRFLPCSNHVNTVLGLAQQLVLTQQGYI
jgi:hypothetical protein